MLRNEELIWTSRSVIKAFYVYSDTVPSNFVKIDRVVSAYPANRQIDTQTENTTLSVEEKLMYTLCVVHGTKFCNHNIITRASRRVSRRHL